MNLNKTQKIISPLLLTLAALIWGLAFTAQKAAQDVPAHHGSDKKPFCSRISLLYGYAFR